MPGADLPHVHTLRTLADSRAIIARATARAERAVVVGASFIGLEVAASLRARGLEVHVVAPEAVPFAARAGPRAGRVPARASTRSTASASTSGRRSRRSSPTRCTLSGGDERVTADLVVLGVGVRPSLELAEAAGLHVDRGVVVDDRLRTSAPGIFAAGDVARYPYAPTGEQVRIEHWASRSAWGASRRSTCWAATRRSRRRRSSGPRTTT